MVANGVAGVLSYTALILAILCSIVEKWNYFDSLLNENDGTKKKHKKRIKKKKKKDKKKHHNQNNDDCDNFISNKKFYHTMGII